MGHLEIGTLLRHAPAVSQVAQRENKCNLLKPSTRRLPQIHNHASPDPTRQVLMQGPVKILPILQVKLVATSGVRYPLLYTLPRKM